MSETDESRTIESRIEIDATIEDVWKALTDPAQIERWFAPNMTVDPRVGGDVLADWGPGIEWKTVIEIWEPNRQLRLVEIRDRMLTPPGVEAKLEPCRLVQDFILEGEGGKTILRFVHSGFGSSRGWDVEYEGTKGGWASCFLRLKQALERHRHSSVFNSIVTTVCYGVGYKQVLKQIAESTPQPFDIALQGEYHMSLVFTELNGSIVSISVQPSSMGSVAYVEMALYALPEEKAVRIRDGWKEKISKLFPTPSGPVLQQA